MGKIDEIDVKVDQQMQSIDARIDARLKEIDAKIGSSSANDCMQTSARTGQVAGDQRVIVSLLHSAVEASDLVAAACGEKDGSRRLAVSIGLNKVNPAAYQGYSVPPLSGCVVDSQRFMCVLERLGFRAISLLDEKATCAAVHGVLRDVAKVLQPGDLFVFHISGHGGRELHEGTKQENWCLYDGAVWKDDILWMFSRFKPGVRILVINDQCHSGGIFQPRLIGGLAAFALLCREDGRPQDWDAESAMNGPKFPMVIQFAGCRAEQTSIDGLAGGTWTQALINTLEQVYARNEDCSYRQWFDMSFASPTLRRGRQDPQWVESPQVTDAFRDRQALS